MAKNHLINRKVSIDDATGDVNIATLTGSGSRMVEADADGKLTATKTTTSSSFDFGKSFVSSLNNLNAINTY